MALGRDRVDLTAKRSLRGPRNRRLRQAELQFRRSRTKRIVGLHNRQHLDHTISRSFPTPRNRQLRQAERPSPQNQLGHQAGLQSGRARVGPLPRTAPEHAAGTCRCRFDEKRTLETADGARSFRPMAGAATLGHSSSSTIWNPSPGAVHRTLRTCACFARPTTSCTRGNALGSCTSLRRSLPEAAAAPASDRGHGAARARPAEPRVPPPPSSAPTRTAHTSGQPSRHTASAWHTLKQPCAHPAGTCTPSPSAIRAARTCTPQPALCAPRSAPSRFRCLLAADAFSLPTLQRSGAPSRPIPRFCVWRLAISPSSRKRSRRNSACSTVRCRSEQTRAPTPPGVRRLSPVSRPRRRRL